MTVMWALPATPTPDRENNNCKNEEKNNSLISHIVCDEEAILGVWEEDKKWEKEKISIPIIFFIFTKIILNKSLFLAISAHQHYTF